MSRLLTLRLATIVALLAMGFGLGACPFTEANSKHCVNNSGDAYCRGLDPERPYCAFDGCGAYDELLIVNGCVAAQPVDAKCYSPCGGRQDANAGAQCSVAGTGTGTATGSASGGGSDTGSGVTETSDSECAACVEQRLACGADGECVPCGAENPCGALRVCLDNNLCSVCKRWTPGRTVAFDEGCGLTDAGTNPDGLGSCDEEANTCFSCTENSDCLSGVCQRSFSLAGPFGATDGWCLPPERVFHVDGSGDDTADGSEATPFATLGHVIELMGTFDPAFVGIIVHEGTYSEALAWEQGMVVITAAPNAAVVFGADEIDPADPVESPTLDLTSGFASVFLTDIAFLNHDSSPAIRGMFSGIGGRRIQVVANPGGGIVGGAIDLRNSFVAGNGVDGENTLALAPDSTLDLLYTTVADNSSLTDGASIRCAAGGENVRIRNSLVGNPEGGSMFLCEGASVVTSVLDTSLRGATAMPVSNNRFAGAAAYDYHLSQNLEMNVDLTIAVAVQGDPPRDFEGDGRVPGSDYVGADVPQG